MQKTYSKIKKITPRGKSKVYDFTVKHTHRILANNFYTSNCDVRHPDVEDFIEAKDKNDKITGANVSIKVNDEFMNAVRNEQDFILRWPVDKEVNVGDVHLPYRKTIQLEDGTYVRKVRASKVWDKIIKQAHKTAEPGVLFWDNIVNESPPDSYQDEGFKTMGTNPCAEVPLSPWDTCRLGSLVLLSFVKNPYTDNAKLDTGLLAKQARIAQRMMDDIIDLEEEKIQVILNKIEKDPEDEEIKENERRIWEKVLDVLRKGRRTGLGVLGLADTLAALGYTYGTKEATEVSEMIMKTIAINSYKESVTLAKERGAFPIWNANKEANNPFISRVISNNFSNEEYDEYQKYGRRNIANLSVAPTGSLSLLTQVTSGIEPVFMAAYKRRRKINPSDEGTEVHYIDQSGDSWEVYTVLHQEFIKWYKNNNNYETIYDAKEKLESLSEEDLNSIVSISPWANSESYNINYMEKINMQSKIQKWIDHSISVTHNLPEKITVEEVKGLYEYAWKVGVKGVTVYREGSRSGVLISNSDKEEHEFPETIAPKRHKELEADYYYAKANGKEFAVIVGKLNNKPYEIFGFEVPPKKNHTSGKIIKVNKGQFKFVNGEFEIEKLELAADRVEERALTLMASMLLRHGAPIKHVNKTIKKIDENITSFSSVIRRTLGRYDKAEVTGELCPNPDCDNELITQEGCMMCMNCGYSKCQ